MSIFKGAAVALVTPMFYNGQVNDEAFGKLIEFQIASGTDAIVVCGTTGEASTLSHEEHLAVIKSCVEKVAGRIPVIAGTGSNCTDTAVYLSTEAEKYGADGLLVVSPYYNKATQKGLYAHFKKVADSVKIPVILYNIKGRTGVNIDPETIVSLCRDVDNIVGVKEASDNIDQIAKLAALGEGIVDIYSGNDNQVLPVMSLGGIGVISTISNIAPKQMHDMCHMFLNGDLTGSRKIQLAMMDLIEKLFCEVNPIPVKKALNLMGMQAGSIRMPLTEMEPDNAAKLEQSMRKFGLM